MNTSGDFYPHDESTTRKPFMVKPKYGGEGRVHFGVYDNGRLALLLLDEHTGGRIAVATVNIPHVQLKSPKYVILKGWSENDGLPEAFEKAGVLSRTGETVPAGRVFAEIALLSEEFFKQLPDSFRISLMGN